MTEEKYTREVRDGVEVLVYPSGMVKRASDGHFLHPPDSAIITTTERALELAERNHLTLEEQRQRDTSPSLPLAGFAGNYESDLFGRLSVVLRDDDLWITCGVHTTKLAHWQHDAFYARAPTRLTYDWLLEFDARGGSRANSVVMRHVGYDAADGPQTFTRVAE